MIIESSGYATVSFEEECMTRMFPDRMPFTSRDHISRAGINKVGVGSTVSGISDDRAMRREML